jgi:hypothetical protein
MDSFVELESQTSFDQVSLEEDGPASLKTNSFDASKQETSTAKTFTSAPTVPPTTPPPPSLTPEEASLASQALAYIEAHKNSGTPPPDPTDMVRRHLFCKWNFNGRDCSLQALNSNLVHGKVL